MMDHVKSSKSCLLTKHWCLLQSFRIPSLLMRMAAWSHNYLRCPASSLCDPCHWPLEPLEPGPGAECIVPVSESWAPISLSGRRADAGYS